MSDGVDRPRFTTVEPVDDRERTPRAALTDGSDIQTHRRALGAALRAARAGAVRNPAQCSAACPREAKALIGNGVARIGDDSPWVEPLGAALTQTDNDAQQNAARVE